MATRATLAKYNRQMQTFEYNIRKLLNDIDRRAKTNEADEDVMEKNLVNTNEDGSRCWSF